MNHKKSITTVIAVLLLICGLKALHSDDFLIGALSSGMRMIFEAEYADENDVNQGDGSKDEFFYKSPDRVGCAIADNSCQNAHHWLVPVGTAGYAYKDILYKGSRKAGGNDRIGAEIRFLANHRDGSFVSEDNRLRVRFVFKVNGLESIADSESLAEFSFVSYDDMNIGRGIWFYHSTEPILSYVLTKQMYLSLPIFDGGNSPACRILEFYLPIQGDHSLQSQGVIKDMGQYLQMINLNPWMYWNGRGNLKLDYVEYYDDLFTTVRSKWRR